MYKTIIVPIDLMHAERIQPMIQAARRLEGEGATLILTNVIEDVPSFMEAQLPAGVIDRLKEQARLQLEELAEGNAPGCEIEVRPGQPAAEILELARERGADLIVIASHQPGFGDFLIGSTAARVVRHADCSVHVIR
ncbi:universal stress protein [Fodinicurvata halophila]|uniref:Universal stress protein n=1 Tax=Fodinicurvata halophila TaxID=1419723 RepID=A0ABV8UMZ3_9PROT